MNPWKKAVGEVVLVKHPVDDRATEMPVPYSSPGPGAKLMNATFDAETGKQ